MKTTVGNSFIYQSHHTVKKLKEKQSEMHYYISKTHVNIIFGAVISIPILNSITIE